MKVVITQSNYIPWKGYFDTLAQADVFVVFDEMQYTKRDWRNRNKIKTASGPKWLTVPVEVKGKYLQKICETKIAESSWAKDHLNLIQHSYSKAQHYKEVFPWLEELYGHMPQITTISEVNRYLIEGINRVLGIAPKIVDSAQFQLLDDKTERLVSICEQLNATEYLTGPAAKNYMNEEAFQSCGIKVTYVDYSNYPEYRQLHPPFDHHVSILDLLFNEGFANAKGFLKHV